MNLETLAHTALDTLADVTLGKIPATQDAPSKEALINIVQLTASILMNWRDAKAGKLDPTKAHDRILRMRDIIAKTDAKHDKLLEEKFKK